MKKSEKLLEALGTIDQRHLPDLKNGAFDFENGGEEAEMHLSSDYKRKKTPVGTVIGAAALTAAAVSLAIGLKSLGSQQNCPDITEVTESSVISEITDTDDMSEISGTTDLQEPFFEKDSPLSPLNLIGCYVDEAGNYRIDPTRWEKSEDFGLFRQYFFGAWENGEAAFGDRLPLFIIDDSEKSFFAENVNWHFDGFYKPNENTLAFIINGNTKNKIFWIGINDPDTMYTDSLSSFVLHGGYSEGNVPTALTKSETPSNEPENNYLSVFRLYEMSEKYGIDFEKLIYIEYDLGEDYEENPGLYIFHDDWYQFYPVYLVSESEELIELKTRLGSESDKNAGAEAECTFQRIEGIVGKWKRTVNLTLNSGAKDVIEDRVSKEIPIEDALMALELLNYYKDDEGYWVNDVDWTQFTDYELFRKYFFGKWGAENSPELGYSAPLIIDDSEKADDSGNTWYSGRFYRVNSHVLAFFRGGTAGGMIYWLDTDKPDILHYAYCGAWVSNTGLTAVYTNSSNAPMYGVLQKSDDPPNEPQNGFFSLYSLYEMCGKYGIRPSTLSYIKYSEAPELVHDLGPNYYPMYLVSESRDEIVLKTILWNYYHEDQSTAIEAVNTVRKINGEWVRSVKLTLPSGETVALPEVSESDITRALPEADALKAAEMLNCREENGGFWADSGEWSLLTDYGLFREYFFGRWSGGIIPELDSDLFTIDDSYKSTVATSADKWYSGRFYRVSGNVLAFIEGDTEGDTVYWLDTNVPDTMYISYARSSESGSQLIHFYNRERRDETLYVTAVRRGSSEPAPPLNRYLSIYALYEMSYKYGIEPETLACVEYSGAPDLVHDLTANFYPMYLLSESEDIIWLKTILWNRGYDKDSAIDADITVEKINGRWERRVGLTFPSGEGVTLDETAAETSANPVYNRLAWETKTAEGSKLPMLTVKPECEYSIQPEYFSESNETDPNPWRDQLITSLPVFRNKLYGIDQSVQGGCTEEKELMRMAETIAEILGLTINKEDTIIYITYENVVKESEYSEEKGKYPMGVRAYCDGTKYGTELVAISVYSDGTIHIRFDKAELIDNVADEGKRNEGYKLPEGIYEADNELTEQNIEQNVKTMNYLISEFGDLLQFESPQINRRISSGYPGLWFTLSVQDAGNSFTEKLLNYNFTYTNFYFNLYDNTELHSIALKDTLALKGEYTGDYPVISAEKAEKILLSGKYSRQYLEGEYNGKRLEYQGISIDETKPEKIDKSLIRNVSLVYRGMNYDDQEYFLPYYRFRVESEPYFDKDEGENMIKSGNYYVPAISEEYIAGIVTDIVF